MFLEEVVILKFKYLVYNKMWIVGIELVIVDNMNVFSP